MDVQKTVILGAGAMGSGIAQVAACSGYQVALMDLERTMLELGLAKIRRALGVKTGRGFYPRGS